MGMLALTRNRSGQAWFIWIPVGLIALVATAAPKLVPSMPSDAADMFAGSIAALGFGLGAVWLTVPYFRSRHRFLTFLGCLFALTLVSTLTWVLREGFEGGVQQLMKALLALFGACGISVAFGLAGLACRRRYRPFVVLLSFLFASLATWFVFELPFAIVTLIGGSGLPVTAFAASVGIIALVSFALVLPFFLLSFANSFYRDRLKALLAINVEAPPVQVPSQTIPHPVGS